MDVRTASELLGCAPDASRTQIESAFRLRARATHPDVLDHPRVAADLAALTEARAVLIATAAREQGAGAPGFDAGADAAVDEFGRRRFVAPSTPPAPLVAPGVIAGGAVLLAAALAFATVGSASPLAPAEPIVRALVLFGGLLGFALTGRRWLFLVTVVVLALTAWTVLAWTSFGALVGALATIPAALILLTAGRRRAELVQWAAGRSQRREE
ncbi:J domain-containing protein [Schumannella soli]|uniref:J domain-containing protein n=1 Tax=Schumannella soli TaxID=2590779 RepID=A0A506Y1Z1_9MICO|nr:J domain-containing protein [Schumannella soli]TPW75913.1 J domain-containing protein [Schumannella soli]